MASTSSPANVSKPAPLDPAQVLDDPECGHAGRSPDPLCLNQIEAVDLAFDHGPVPIQKPSEGLAFISSHAQGVVHSQSLRLEEPPGPRPVASLGVLGQALMTERTMLR